MPSWQADWLPRLAGLAQDQRLAVLATLLLVLLLADGLARLTWTLVPAPPVEVVPAAAPAAPAGTPQTGGKTVNASEIRRLHLFGEAGKAAPRPVAKVVDAPETRLNLKLHGVMASDDPAIARAIIADGKGKEDAYAVDDQLPGNAVLKEILPDRIILEYRGRLETLRLPKQVDKGVSTQGRASAADRSRRSPPMAAGTSDTGALLRQYREALATDPQSVMDLVRAEPVRDRASGKLKGYRLRPGRDRQLLGRFGLRPGDVVTSINGIPMDNPLKALELMRDISNISQIDLEVERNGTPQSFSFQIE